MSLLVTVFVGALVASCDNVASSLKTCDDCVVLTECRPSFSRVKIDKSQETSRLLLSSFCGMKNFENNVVAVKVCCSDWSNHAPIAKTINVRFDNETHSRELHANVGLLPAECGGTVNHRIVGGHSVLLYEFPWMALIAYETRLGLEFLCAGTIINSRYILTAAHCVKSHMLNVRLGEFNVNEEQDCQYLGQQSICERYLQEVGIEAAIVHENFTLGSVNDIALLRLNATIDFSHRNVHPICLPVDQKLRNAPRAAKMTVAGWGATETGTNSEVLLKTFVDIYSDQRCNEFLIQRYPNGDYLNGHFICASAMGKDSCDGDSGGPLMYEGEYQDAFRIIQGGVISQGPQYCGKSATPGIYTDVAKYMDWILDHLRPDTL